MFSFVASLAFVIFLSLEMRHYMVQATFDSDCNLVGLKTLEKNGNKSSVMKLRSQIPSSRIPTHSCTVKTNKTNSILYLRAKRNRESKKGESKEIFWCLADSYLSICHKYSWLFARLLHRVAWFQAYYGIIAIVINSPLDIQIARNLLRSKIRHTQWKTAGETYYLTCPNQGWSSQSKSWRAEPEAQAW